MIMNFVRGCADIVYRRDKERVLRQYQKIGLNNEWALRHVRTQHKFAEKGRGPCLYFVNFAGLPAIGQSAR